MNLTLIESRAAFDVCVAELENLGHNVTDLIEIGDVFFDEAQSMVDAMELPEVEDPVQPKDYFLDEGEL
jgi:hypothetical protein